MDDLYARRKSNVRVDGEDGAAHSSSASASGGGRSRRSRRSRPVPLALMGDALTALTVTHTRNKDRHGERTSASAGRPPASLSSTSLSLVCHFLSLRCRLSCGRVCRSWSEATASRLAWSGSEARVIVHGTREERRMAGGVNASEMQRRNFNPNDAHHSRPTVEDLTGGGRANTDDTPAPSRDSLSAASLLSTYPLTYVSTRCRHLSHLRHLVYHFAPPAIRTSLSLHTDDMFVTDVVCAEFPLADLTAGALPFLSSLSLRDVTVCSQPSLQSAFGRLGVQSHSFLRALELRVSPLLSQVEQARTLRAVLSEVGARMSHLEILALPQRLLPRDVPLEDLLSLRHLRTLVLDASFAKTSERIQVVKALALHGRLEHIVWPGWNSAQLKHLFGGVRRSADEEEEEARQIQEGRLQMVDSHHQTGSDDDDDDQEEEAAILGLDDDELPPGDDVDLDAATTTMSLIGAAAPLSGVALDNGTDAICSFRFTEWTIDDAVSEVNLLQYFACTPPLLPHLHTLHLDCVPTTTRMAQMMEAMTALTALRITDGGYGKRERIWNAFAQVKVPMRNLRRLRVDQVSLVAARPGAGTEDAADDHDDDPLWRTFPSLTELTLAHTLLPRLVGLAAAAPALRDLRLDTVGLSSQCGTVDGTSARELISEIAACQQVTRVDLIHAGVDLTQLAPLARCPQLALLRVCARGPLDTHRDAHDTRTATIDNEWTPTSARFFARHDASERGGAEAQSAASHRQTRDVRSRAPMRHPGGGIATTRDQHSAMTLHRDMHAHRRRHHSRAPECVSGVGAAITFWDTDTGAKRTIDAEKIR